MHIIFPRLILIHFFGHIHVYSHIPRIRHFVGIYAAWSKHDQVPDRKFRDKNPLLGKKQYTSSIIFSYGSGCRFGKIPIHIEFANFDLYIPWFPPNMLCQYSFCTPRKHLPELSFETSIGFVSQLLYPMWTHAIPFLFPLYLITFLLHSYYIPSICSLFLCFLFVKIPFNPH